MSRSPEEETAAHNAERNQVNLLLNKMMLEGRSFSGHERNCCYLNCGAFPNAQERFANISAASGIDFPDDGRALVTMDWDQDGDLDIWTANRNAPRLRFLQNELDTPHQSITLKLEGNGTTVNRDAIGTRVEVLIEDKKEPADQATSQKKQIQTVRAGEGFLSQNSKRLHFGFGQNQRIKGVIVTWPDGQTEKFGAIEHTGHYRLVQGSASAVEMKRRKKELEIYPGNQTLPPKKSQATLRPLAPLVFPPLTYQTLSGGKTQIPVADKPLLINLWASWCQPCLKELVAFSRNAAELDEAGLEVIALNVDGLGDDTTVPEEAAKFVDRLQLPFTFGRADAKLLDQLQQLHDMQTTLRPPLPLPTSFLIDAEGRLLAIYKGPIEVDTILNELEVTGKHRDNQNNLSRVAGLPGSIPQHPEISKTLEANEVEQRFQFAKWLQTNGFNKQAIKQYQNIIRIRPDSAKGEVDLGSALLEGGDLDGAEEAFKKALILEPESSRAHLRLGSLYLKRGQKESALIHLESAQTLSPEDVSIVNNLGTLYDQMGKYPEAIKQFNHAIELMPGEPGSYNNLAWLQATCANPDYRDPPKAIELARKACELTGWNDFSTLDTLATAYAANENWKEAEKWQAKAMEYAPQSQRADLKRRLNAYQKKNASPNNLQ